MEIVFLGTAAAEGLPAPFCSCETCEKARRNGGKDLRARASVLVDRALRIDISGDAVMQAQRLGYALDSLKTLLVTHIHTDHFSTDEFLWLMPPFSRTYEGKLRLVGPKGLVEELIRARVFHRINQALEIHTLMPFEEAELPGGYRAASLLAYHDPERLCLNYVVKDAEGKTLLYAADTGVWREETFAFLKEKGIRMDAVIMEATSGDAEKSERHLNLKGLLEMRKRLLGQGNIGEKTPYYTTHYSHNGRLLQADLEEMLGPHNITPAYDGLRVEV